jgi:predicted metal-dependent hydrolase
VRDPRGHAYGAEAAPAVTDPLDEAGWRSHHGYLLAVDLFNSGYFWECHEALEAPWRLAGRGSAVGERLQGLIQLAGAMLKHAVGDRRGARRLAARGARRLRSGPAVRLGLDGPALAAAVEAYVADAPGAPRPYMRLEGDPPTAGTPGAPAR